MTTDDTTTDDGVQSVTIEGPRVDRVVSKDGWSYSLSGALVSPAAGDDVYVTATDGRICGVVRVPGCVAAPTILPPEVMTKRQGRETYTLADGEWRSKNGGRVAPVLKGEYPNILGPGGVEDAPPECVVVGIDAKQLANLAAMIGDYKGVVTLLILDPTRPVRVLGEKGFGAIMPYGTGPADRAVTEFNAARAEYAAAYERRDDDAE